MSKLSELKFVRRTLPFLFECSLFMFLFIHLPHISVDLCKFGALSCLSMLSQFEISATRLTDIKMLTHSDRSVRIFAQGLLAEQAAPSFMTDKHKKIVELAKTAREKSIRESY